MKKQNLKALLVLFLIAIMIFPVAGCFGKEEPPPPEENLINDEDLKEEEEEEEEDKSISVKKIKPVTVVINNHSASRPHSGLQKASIVYEFLAEGGITRYLAVFDTYYEDDFTIGPIRSLRPYFAVQAMEHGGIIAHSGSSHRTQELIRNLGIRQITNYSHFWRDSSRNAPHNLYTSIEKLHKAAGGDFSPWNEEYILEENLRDSQEGHEIEVVYSNFNKVSYTYDQKTDTYLRFINESPHKDRETGKQYSAHRVIIRTTPHSRVTGTDLMDINLEGKGQGQLYQGGKKYTITWEKKEGKTEFFYSDGSPVELGWGNTWIQVTP